MIRGQVTKISCSAWKTCTMSVRPSYSVPLQRQFHSGRQTQMDILGFLRGRKEQPGLAPVKAESTSKVIKDIEERQSRNEMSKNLDPVELEVIGLPVEELEWNETQRNGFEVNAFPIHQVNPEVTQQEVDVALYNAYSEVVLKNPSSADNITIPAEWVNTEITDLTVRLQFLKHIMKALNTAIADNKLVDLSSINALQGYFSTKAIGRKFNEKEPDAIYLDPNDFKGTNITILDAPISKKERLAKWQQLVEEARKAEDEKLGKTLDAAMS